MAATTDRAGRAVPAGRPALARLFPATPPPGPFRPAFWRSPLRGPWLTAVLGSFLLVLVGVVAVTGFLSHAAYSPGLRGNAIVPAGRDLPVLVDWPTRPSWLYALTQGLHTTVGLAVVPVLLAKLWSVIPRLFAWPPLATPAQALERAVLALLVGSAGFELATGVANMQYWYPFGFNFVVAHYYGAVVFVASLAAHLVVKAPLALRAVRARGVLEPLRAGRADTAPEPDGVLVAAAPAAPTVSRRGLLAGVGLGALVVALANAGQSLGGPLRGLAVLAPRREPSGPGPNDFQVNKTAAAAGVTAAMTGEGWRLRLLLGTRELALSRADLLAMPQRTATLPIACVEGWSTTQRWTGVPLAALAERAGAPGAGVFVESLQPSGPFRRASLTRDQVADPRSLLALAVNGAALSPDHGFPARVIVPALPGVHNTKWVAAMAFEERAA
jgi:DMSO/TMAO reductase YedYZ molybdopterin-dependent catalytic subunit